MCLKPFISPKPCKPTNKPSLLQALPELIRFMDAVHNYMCTINKHKNAIKDSEEGDLPPPKAESLVLRCPKPYISSLNPIRPRALTLNPIETL